PSARARALQGWEAYKRNDFDEAIERYSEAIRLNPRLAWAYNGRGTALGMKGKHAEAIRDFTEAIRLQSNVADYYANRAWVRNLGRDFTEAVRDCDQALQINPTCALAIEIGALAHNALGALAYLRRDFDEVLAQANEVIRLKPDFAPAYSARGVALG